MYDCHVSTTIIVTLIQAGSLTDCPLLLYILYTISLVIMHFTSVLVTLTAPSNTRTLLLFIAILLGKEVSSF
jgi:hypothetical protein